MLPDTSIEYDLRVKGIIRIAGIDEAGRGCLAGPVVAAAVILPTIFNLPDLNDSKKLTAKKREELFILINKQACAVSIGIIDNITIDKINILQATLEAMKQAVTKLPVKPDYLLIDGNKTIESSDIKQKAIVKGDSKSVSIAAASIIAKVTRDKIMLELAQEYPEYGFSKNKGYGTEKHRESIFNYGQCPIHRKTFNVSTQMKLF